MTYKLAFTPFYPHPHLPRPQECCIFREAFLLKDTFERLEECFLESWGAQIPMNVSTDDRITLKESLCGGKWMGLKANQQVQRVSGSQGPGFRSP